MRKRFKFKILTVIYNFLNKQDSMMIRYNFGEKCMFGQTKGLS